MLACPWLLARAPCPPPPPQASSPTALEVLLHAARYSQTFCLRILQSPQRFAALAGTHTPVARSP